MTIRNLTPHPIVIEIPSGERVTFPPEGIIPRVSSKVAPCGEFLGVPLSETVFGEVEGLPEAEEGTILIVSGFVLDRVRESRPDVFRPDTGQDCIRNEKGQIVAVRRLTR